MKKLPLLSFIPIFALAAIITGCSPSQDSRSTAASNDKTVIAAIPKATGGDFWETVEQGARRAATELDIELKWEGTATETEIAEQTKIIENMINLEVDGMAIAPLNKKATAKPVQRAIDASIPVVIFDSAVGLDTHVSFVATNNLRGGALGAETMAELLGVKLPSADGKALTKALK